MRLTPRAWASNVTGSFRILLECGLAAGLGRGVCSNRSSGGRVLSLYEIMLEDRINSIILNGRRWGGDESDSGPNRESIIAAAIIIAAAYL